MSTATYTVTINRPLYELVSFLDEIEAEQVPPEGGLGFEAVRGGKEAIAAGSAHDNPRRLRTDFDNIGVRHGPDL